MVSKDQIISTRRKGTAGRQNRMEVLREKSDEELMELFQGGVVAAFDILVDRYAGRLSAYLYRFVGDAYREDLLQETFMRVYRNRHSYRRIAKFSTWLYTIAGNLARSEYRRRKRHRATSLQAVDQSDETYELELPAGDPTPDVDTDDALVYVRLQEALDELPPEFKEVVILRDVQQLSYDEIAEITALPLGTVKSRINRGRGRLQNMLRDVYPYA